MNAEKSLTGIVTFKHNRICDQTRFPEYVHHLTSLGIRFVDFTNSVAFLFHFAVRASSLQWNKSKIL